MTLDHAPPEPTRPREETGAARTGPAPATQALQSAAGNRAVAQFLGGGAPVVVSRTPDTDSAAPSNEALYAQNFNAGTITNDLIRAINQSEHNYVPDANYMHDVAKERRNVDAPKVIAVLSNLTASQVAEVERRYLAYEKRTLDTDLFGTGQSGRQSSLTSDQVLRIRALLKGTKGEPIPDRLQEDLKKFPPEIAASYRVALADKADASAALVRFESDAVELHELLSHDLDEVQRERVMTLHRREKISEIDAIDKAYDWKYGSSAMTYGLARRLSGLQRTRLAHLREGRWAQADACAIEDKRLQIEAVNKVLEEADGFLGSIAGLSGPGEAFFAEQAKKKQELTAGIDAILETNRQEALHHKDNAAKSSGQAVAERLQAILGQQAGDPGHTLLSQLTSTLGVTHGSALAASIDVSPGATAGSARLIESAARELMVMEADHTTTTAKVIAILQSFRPVAKHDLVASMYDPAVDPAEKERIAADLDGAVDGLAQRYIREFQSAYSRLRGDGRTYAKILASADDADTALMQNIGQNAGESTDLGDLQHAMGKENVDKVKEVLRRQPNREAVTKLTAEYNKVEGHDLLAELFGHDMTGQVNMAWAMAVEKRRQTGGGLVTSRDAMQVAEMLAMPTTDELDDKKAAKPGQAEMDWLATGGQAEYDVTMLHRGLIGRLREAGDNPETENLLDATAELLPKLRADWEKETDPTKKQHLMIEMRKARATLTGDADAYEKDNAAMLAQIQGALTFAVSIALAIAIPGAGATLVAFLETTALNIAATIASNIVIKGGDYGLADLKADLIGGVLGAAGGRYGEKLLSKVAKTIVAPSAKAAAGAAEKYGINTALKTEATALVTGGERAAIAAEEFELAQAGREAASVVNQEAGLAGREASAAGREVGAAESAVGREGTAAAEGAAGASSAVAVAPSAAERLFVQGAGELGGFFGGMFLPKAATGDMSMSLDEFVMALISTAAGKLGARDGGAQSTEGPHGTKQSAHETAPPADGGVSEHATADLLAKNGIPPKSADGFQMLADQHNLVLKVRPTNLDSLPHLEGSPAHPEDKAMPKPEFIKAKTLNPFDAAIGGPGKEHTGKVGFFEPTMPSEAALARLNDSDRANVVERFNQRHEEFQHHKAEYAQLIAEGLMRVEGGVLQIADPRVQGTAAEPFGKFRDVGGDHDVYDITHSDGSPLTADERSFIIKHARSLGINIEHGFHTAWPFDSPGTFSPRADASIRTQHEWRVPLMAFVPKSAPREAWASSVVHGPARTEGPGDRFTPLSSLEVVGPRDRTPSAPTGGGGPDAVHNKFDNSDADPAPGHDPAAEGNGPRPGPARAPSGSGNAPISAPPGAAPRRPEGHIEAAPMLDAFKKYKQWTRDDPTREVALAYNFMLDKWAVIQGAPGVVDHAEPAKRELGWDPDHIVLDRHFHPVKPETGLTALASVGPSGAGADLPLIGWEAETRKTADPESAGRTAPHMSTIDVVIARGESRVEDRVYVVYDHNNKSYTVDAPIPGDAPGRDRQTFTSVFDFHEWFYVQYGREPGNPILSNKP